MWLDEELCSRWLDDAQQSYGHVPRFDEETEGTEPEDKSEPCVSGIGKHAYRPEGDTPFHAAGKDRCRDHEDAPYPGCYYYPASLLKRMDDLPEQIEVHCPVDGAEDQEEKSHTQNPVYEPSIHYATWFKTSNHAALHNELDYHGNPTHLQMPTTSQTRYDRNGAPGCLGAAVGIAGVLLASGEGQITYADGWHGKWPRQERLPHLRVGALPSTPEAS